MRMGRIKTPLNKALAGALLVLAATRGARAEAPPDPQKLLSAVLEPSAVAFEGRMMVTHWYGKHHSEAEEVHVYHLPPNLSRREFTAPDGTVTKVVVSDGDREEVHLIRQKKIIEGDAVKSFEKLMPEDRELELLLKNYKLSVTGPDQVAGRKAWVLHMASDHPGKPSQDFWVDQETHAILENRRFLPHRPFAALSRYSHFETKKTLPEDLFKLELSSSAIQGKGLEPDFMSLDELSQTSGKKAAFPVALNDGFVFESADYLTVGKHTVLHARYTDGLAVISLFQTDRPARSTSKTDSQVAAPASSAKGAGQLRLSASAKVLNFRRGPRFYTLMGDVSREMLQEIAAQVK